MRSPTKQDGTRNTERRAKTARAATSPKGESHVEPTNTPKGAVVTSMVDALEDILKWERASERAMRVATEQSTTELDPSN
jgi:hypothetical protein